MPFDMVGVAGALSNLPTQEFFAGESEMARLMREFDWSKTSLGPPESWPQSLRTSVRIVLTSRFSMWLAWGPDLVFFYNDAYRSDTLGIKHPKALGQSFYDVWAEVMDDLNPRVQHVLSTGTATWDEALPLFLERSGFAEETYHTFSYSPLADDDGNIAGVFCVVTEETERVIGERRLSLLRDLANQLSATETESEVHEATRNCLAARPLDMPFALTYLFDPEGTTATLANTFGFQPYVQFAPTILDSDDPDVVWPVSDLLSSARQVTIENLDSHFADLPTGPWNKPPRQAVLLPISQQGKESLAGFLVVGINPYRQVDQAYSGFLDLFAGQISSGLASARAYEAERRRAEELSKLDQAKTAFFSNVSHELRTPLTLMIGPLTELISQGDDLSAECLETIEVVQRNSLRLLKLVNTLLEFSRLEAGRVQANYQLTDLSSFTAEIASVFRSACEHAGLQLKIECPKLSQPVYVDRTMWEKIVLNLLSNALKFTFSGEIRVSVREQDQMAVLAITDTGTGIPKEAQPHLFDRFYRVDGARGRTHEGTGIGLALVRELSELHGGRVTAESEVAVGSSFFVCIPFGKDHLSSDRILTDFDITDASISDAYLQEALHWVKSGELGTKGEKHGSPEVVGLRPRIVLADDNADLRAYLCRLLVDTYDVEAVANGAEALQAAKRKIPDLILTDVMMPVLDGFGLLAEVRKDKALKDLPVVMLSARAGEEARVEGLQVGADDYLVKPFSARELLARVKSNLELTRLRRLSTLREEKLRVAAESAYERVKYFAEALPQMVSERDSQGRLRWANDHFYEYTGLPPGTFPGSEGLDLVHPLDRDRYQKAWANAVKNGENLNIEMRLRRYDGQVNWWLITSVPIRDAEGKVERFFTSSTNIQAQKEAEQELERRVEERTAALLEANKEMEGFTYTVSHDLRSPLRSIILNSSLLIEQIGNELLPDQLALLHRQVSSAKRLARVIDDLLKASRVSKQAIVLTEIDLSHMAEMVTEQLRKGSDQFCIVKIQPGMRVLADPTLIEFVMLNLIENATKFSMFRGEVEVGLESIGPDQCYYVKDSGIGFDPTYSNKIFEPFERLVTEQEFPGTGIGLSNVKRIVERHGGRVWAESTPGEGAKFLFTLGGG